MWNFRLIFCIFCLLPRLGEGDDIQDEIRLICFNVEQADNDNVIMLTSDFLIVRCELRFFNNSVVSQAHLYKSEEPVVNTFTTTILNSTFEKVYSWSTEFYREWKVIVLKRDFFEPYSDWKIPKIHPFSILQWTVVTTLCNPILYTCLEHHTVMSYLDSDPIYHFSWGKQLNPVANNTGLDSVKYINFASLPCKSGSGLLFMSSSTKTVIFATWNAFKPHATRLYEMSCSTLSLPNCTHNLVVYDACFVYDKLLLLTSNGLFASSMFSKNYLGAESSFYKLPFAKVQIPILETSELRWDLSRLMYNPSCSRLDHIYIGGDAALAMISIGNKMQTIASVKPYEKWEVIIPEIEPNLNIALATLSTQTDSIITFITKSQDNNNSTYVRVYRSSRRHHERPEYPEACLNDFVPVDVVLLSNSFLLVSGYSSIWLSSDGGNMFERLVQLQSQEYVIQSVSQDFTKSVAFLTSKGRIFQTRIGVQGMQEISWNWMGDINMAKLFFDHGGKLHVVTVGSGTTPTLDEIKLNYTVGMCRFSMIPGKSIGKRSMIYIDVGTFFSYSVTGFLTKGVQTLDKNDILLSTTVGNSNLFQFSSEIRRLNAFSEQVVISIENRQLYEGTSTITIAFRGADVFCPITSHVIVVRVSCPPNKRLEIEYSSFVGDEFLLSMEEYVNSTVNTDVIFNLEPNYRPPSAIAIAIPLSGNIYNFHPELANQTQSSKYGSAEKFSISSYCSGKSTRSECSCSSALKYSSLESHSDCRERVYRVKYNIQYPISLRVVNNDDEMQSIYSETDHVVYFEEVNGRTNDVYYITDGSTESCEDNPVPASICYLPKNDMTDIDENSTYIRTFMTHGTNRPFYNATTLNLKFLGTGLFHFRITLARGFSFCLLQDEFQVYVTNPPLPFPVGTIIRLTVSALMGGTLSFIYIYTLLKSSPPKTNVRKSLTNKQNEDSSTARRKTQVTEEDLISLRAKFRASLQTKSN